MQPRGKGNQPPSDVAWLVLRAQSGDRLALEELLRETQRSLRAYVSSMVSRPELAPDVMQELLLTVYRKLGALKEPRAYWAWVRRIASRQVMAAAGTRHWDATLYESLDESAEIAAAPAELTDGVRDLVRKLPPAAREVMVLHYSDGFTIHEVAAILDLPVGTIKSRLAYGLKALRERIERQ